MESLLSDNQHATLAWFLRRVSSLEFELSRVLVRVRGPLRFAIHYFISSSHLFSLLGSLTKLLILHISVVVPTYSVNWAQWMLIVDYHLLLIPLKALMVSMSHACRSLTHHRQLTGANLEGMAMGIEGMGSIH